MEENDVVDDEEEEQSGRTTSKINPPQSGLDPKMQ